MAFHQPTRQAVQRPFRPAREDDELHTFQPAPTQPVEESQTWVLFSPATDAGTATSYTASTHHSNVTLGRSNLSDVRSLDILGQSEASGERQHTGSFVDAVDEEDDPELDSLDSHLPEFRSTPDIYAPSQNITHATPVVPAHDGLGSFHIEHEGMGIDVQNRLYAFEQYNPHRMKRRRESLDPLQADVANDEEAQELDKMRRIESWRLEQSRYLLEEIQKETRRQRRSVAGGSKTRSADKSSETPSLAVRGIQGDSDEAWHDQIAGNAIEEREKEGIWGRITRKVIQDFIGIDDRMLSILFGEALPDEDDLSTTPKASAPATFHAPADVLPEGSMDSGWQIRLLERVAKELGSLVHQLSEHPGAFSTFTRVQQMPMPYAGLPVIPEGTNVRASEPTTLEDTTTVPEFQPTLPTAARPIDVPRTRRPSESAHPRPAQVDNGGAAFTQEEWEQDLDIRLVFRYLRSRFVSRPNGNSGLSGTSHLTTSNSQDIAAKVARVRQHHPLVSRSRTMERRKSKGTVVSNPALFRPASSCASQSTRRSVRRSSASSSRHYWDLGGSIGSGSMVATTGPMGSWGEV